MISTSPSLLSQLIIIIVIVHRTLCRVWVLPKQLLSYNPGQVVTLTGNQDRNLEFDQWCRQQLTHTPQRTPWDLCHPTTNAAGPDAQFNVHLSRRMIVLADLSALACVTHHGCAGPEKKEMPRPYGRPKSSPGYPHCGKRNKTILCSHQQTRSLLVERGS